LPSAAETQRSALGPLAILEVARLHHVHHHLRQDALHQQAGNQDCSVVDHEFTSISIPATDKPDDVEAARRHMFTIQGRDLLNTGLWFDPIFRGRYADGWHEAFGAFEREPLDETALSFINQPLDFMGANIYQGKYVRAGTDGVPEELPYPPGKPASTYDWNITPDVLYWGPRFLYERYQRPIYITENGVATTDWVSEDGCVHDPQRQDYLKRYLRELKRAVGEGFPVHGYFHWALMDNLEWADGFKHRFGLIHVDYATQQRRLKDSAYWYRDVIASNGSEL
jgi:beta-glucosidase